MGQTTQIHEAPDPTNVIWEDLGITGRRLMCKNIIANIVMFLLVFSAFLFFWFLRYIPNTIRARYPTTIDCKNFYNTA